MDPYEVLGVPRDAPHDELKRAWRRLARSAHPDRNRDDPGAADRFKRIAEAWHAIGDPARRRAHDLRAGRASQAELPDAFVEDVANAIERAQTWIEGAVLPHVLTGWRGRGAEAVARFLQDQERLAVPGVLPATRRARRRAARLAARMHVAVDLAPARDLAGLRRTADGRWFVVVTPWALWAGGVRDAARIDDAVLRTLLPRYAFALADGRVLTLDPAEGRRVDDDAVAGTRRRAALWGAVGLAIAVMWGSAWFGI